MTQQLHCRTILTPKNLGFRTAVTRSSYKRGPCVWMQGLKTAGIERGVL